MFINSVAMADVSIGAALSVPGCHSILCDGFCPRQAFIPGSRQSLKMSVQCCQIIALYGENFKKSASLPIGYSALFCRIVLQKHLFTSRLNVNCPLGNLVLHSRNSDILRCLKWVYPLIQLRSVCYTSLAQTHISARY